MTLPWDTTAGQKFFVWVLAMTVLSTFGMLYGGAADAAVLIAEICADPASDWDGDGAVDSRDDEWIEILNTGPEAVDLTAYYVRDALGDGPHLRLSGVLAPGASAAFLGSDAAAWQAESGEGSAGLSLNNAGDLVQLFLGHPLEADAVMVDVVAYDDHVADDDRSTALMLPEGDWVLCDALNPYGGALEPVGTGCPPTPGAANVCEGLVPNERVDWGHLKSAWR